jgi:hypothetical protein
VGVDLFGDKANLYKIPGIGLFILIVNILITRLVKNDRQFLSFLSALITLLISVALCVSVIFLLKVN